MPPDTNSYTGRPAVILAAGLGARLATHGKGSPAKPLLPVHGVPLLLRTLHSVELAGCDHAVIVLGHQAVAIRRAIESAHKGRLELHYVINPSYRLQNGISVLCARLHVAAEFILTMADHVFDETIMQIVRCNQPPAGGATLCVDYKLDSIFDIDDATKVLERDGAVVAIGKNLEAYNCVDTGIFLCTPALMDAIEGVYRDTGDASLSEGVARLAAAGTMRTLDVGDAFWQDVDTPEMLTHAEGFLVQRATG